MTSPSNVATLVPRDLADYGFARARDVAFDAVRALWARRRREGMKQVDIANAIGRDTAWVSRSLRGPGNWTLRTLGELVEALNGEIEIKIHALEDSPSTNSNYHAYAGYEPVPAASSTVGTLTFGDPTKQKIIKDAFPTSGASALSAVPGGA